MMQPPWKQPITAQRLAESQPGSPPSLLPVARRVRLSYLQLVDVGRMVPAAAQLGGSFTAAVWDESLVLLQPRVLGPVCVVVTPATLKLCSGTTGRHTRPSRIQRR